MTLPIPLDRASDQTLQEQIYRFIRDQILLGHYRENLQIPSTRDLAASLHVSRNTAVLAYQWLASEGYIETRQGAGTFICKVVSDQVDSGASAHAGAADEGRRAMPEIVIPWRAPMLVDRTGLRPPYDFWYGRPDPRQFPSRIWARLVAENLARARVSLAEYGPQSGHLELREAIADYLATAKGIITTPDRILITAGAQEALNIISRMLIAPGTPVAIEDPGYASAASLFESYGGLIHPVGIDEKGLIADALPAVAPKLVYTTPSHQFPTGVVMTLDRRQALLEQADRLGCYIIEDDYDGEIIYDRPPIAALAALDRQGRVMYVGSFSKSVGAGIRAGFIALPHELIEPATAVKSMSSYGQSWLDQTTLATFIRDGSFRAHLRRIRTLYRARRDILIDALHNWMGDAVIIDGHESGLHLMVTIPEHMPDATAIVRAAVEMGVILYTPVQAGATELQPPPSGDRRLVLGYAALTPAEIQTAIGLAARATARLEP